MKTTGSNNEESPAQLIDARIEELDDWRGETLSRLRADLPVALGTTAAGAENAGPLLVLGAVPPSQPRDPQRKFDLIEAALAAAVTDSSKAPS